MPRKGGVPENLKSYKPGQSGNLKGRPKKIPDLEVLLSEKGESEYQAVINSLFKQAKKGNVRAAEVLLDRAYGKSKQEIRIDTVESQVMVIGGQRIEF